MLIEIYLFVASCIAIFALALISVALANRAIVPLKVLPTEVSHWFALNPQIELPLFVVIFGGVLIGLIIGYCVEYLREHKHRAEASRKGAEVKTLERQLKRTQAERDKDKDEVLALLDQAS